MALAWLRDGTERLRVMGTRLWAVGTTLAAALAVLGIAGAGPLAGLGAQAGVELRLHYWQAALGMVGAEPLTGVGLDRYGAYFREYRSDAAVAALSGEIDVDAAHSVPLNLLAGGGLPLGLAYLAVVLAVGWMLVRGLTRLWGAPLRLLGAFGGAWVAYQVQSLVSFDVPPLAVLGWVTAGAVVVAAGGAAVIDVRLPWWKTSVLRRGSGLLPHAPGLRLLVAGTLVLGGVAAVGALTPLYADVLGRAAAEARDTDPQRAIAAAERATGLAPWRPEYWREVGAAYLRAGLVEQAATALERGVRADPRHLALVLSAAGAAAAMGDEQRAAALYEQAVAIEPRAPDVLLEAAEFLAEAGRPERASDLVRTVLAFDPTNTKGLDLERELADASS